MSALELVPPPLTASERPSPEHSLLLLAARFGDEPLIAAHVRRLLDTGIDWTRLIRAALAQRLIAPLAARLDGIGEPLVPGDMDYALRFRVHTNAERNALLLAASEELAQALRAQGMAALFFDGPALALLAHGSLGSRDPVTPCVLIEPQDRLRFQEVVAAPGFRPQKDGSGAVRATRCDAFAGPQVYRRPADEAVVHVYTCIVPRMAGIRLDHASLFERAAPLPDGAHTLRVPSLEDTLLLMSLRAGLAGWPAFGTARDLAYLLHHHPEIDRVTLQRRARGQGCERMLQLALTLMASLADEADSAALPHTGVQGLAVRIRARLLDDAFAADTVLGVDRLQWRLRDSLRERLHYVAHTGLARARRVLPARRRAARPIAVRAAQEAKARNEAHWGGRSQSWERWAERGKAGAEEFNRALLEAVGAVPGQRILDLACGVGDTALDVAPAVGASGSVVAADLAFDMIGKARRRADGSSITNLHCCAADMENLPFRDSSFDGIVCRLGIMYAPHPERALQEARRVLVSGARAAYLVCGPQDDNPVLRIVHEVVTELFALQKGDAAIQPFRFAEQGSLARLMIDAGFRAVREQALGLHHRVPAGSRFWQASLERGLGIALEKLPPLTLAELEQRMTDAFAPYFHGTYYELPSLSRVTVGSVA